MYFLSGKSRHKLQDAHADLVVLASTAITYTNIDFGISEVARTLERQKLLMEQGKSWTMNSRHIPRKVKGLKKRKVHALDFFAWVDGAISWEEPHYYEVHDAFVIASQHTGIPFEWGGHWKVFDGPHIQLPWDEYPIIY